MRFKGLDLNLLVALDVLLAERSVTRAAARMHLTQSAMSCALGRLRNALGDELLVQAGKKMILTPFANALREQVRQILTMIDSTMRSNPGFEPQVSQRHFRIAASDFINEIVMARVQRALYLMAPGISLDLLPVLTDEVFGQMHRGEIDLIIVPQVYCHPGSSQAQLFQDSWMCLAWAENETVGETISLEQYLAMDHVILQTYGQTVALDQQYFNARKLQRRVKVTAPVFTLIPHLLVGTNRIATVPSRLLETYIRVLPLKSSRPQFRIPMLTETMQWHPSRDRDLALAWLRKLILDIGRSTSTQEGRAGTVGERKRVAAAAN